MLTNTIIEICSTRLTTALRRPFNCHRHTLGRQPHPTATAIRVGHQPHTTATATHEGTSHIQLAPPNSWVLITSNCHGHTLGHQPQPTAADTHAGTNHIQLSPANTGTPTTSNCHGHIRGNQPHLSHIATRVGSQPQPTATATRPGTNHIQLAPPNL